MNILKFQRQTHKPERACAGCGSRFPKDAPTFWRYCSKCYGYGMFRKAVQSFMRVQP
jgi:protein-arginine kinase activator protein McsA